MSKQDYLDWIESLKAEGYSDEEIEEIIQRYLEQSIDD